MNQKMAESVMSVFRLHVDAITREKKEKALARIRRQRFFSPIPEPIDEAAAAFIRHITTPEIEPQLAAGAEERDWLIDSMDPISCQADELDRLFHECQRAGDAERAAYLLGCRDVRMRVSLLEGTDEWRALESVGNKSEISRTQQAKEREAME
ncbi:MAG: hypothetical protein ABS92_04785 [Thiobacillus sp. SCN 63-374]|nr:MAG: hypothetical protein ABS92_04785 [Thiobacillus sp. SCN 63-374]